jgi:hypothetical protein
MEDYDEGGNHFMKKQAEIIGQPALDKAVPGQTSNSLKQVVGSTAKV